MKKYLSILLIVVLLPGATKTVTNSPSGLMVEFIREPDNVQILDLKPEFSWIVPTDANIQTAYQILVASSEEKLENNSGDIWDSRKVISNRSSEVEFGEKSLSKNSLFFWKVRIWNTKNESTKYSEIQSFTTGDPVNYLTTGNKFQTSLISPEKFIKTGDNHFFFDFGKDAFGTLVLEINSSGFSGSNLKTDISDWIRF